jgi:hypothetical protein
MNSTLEQMLLSGQELLSNPLVIRSPLQTEFEDKFLFNHKESSNPFRGGKQLLNQIGNLSFLQNKFNAGKELLEIAPKFTADIKYNKKTFSTGFNPIQEFFQPGETTHSRIIAWLLNPRGSHGQENLFLIPFLRYLNICEPEKGSWRVTAEKGRIDILLRREEPLSVIVIENKSNWANDQGHQLYRYWHKEIKPHFPEDTGLNDSDRHRIIYLAPNQYKHPEPHSYTRPNDSKHSSDSLPQEISYQFLTFSSFRTIFLDLLISENLETNSSPLHPQNFRLIGFLTTYFDLWN